MGDSYESDIFQIALVGVSQKTIQQDIWQGLSIKDYKMYILLDRVNSS